MWRMRLHRLQPPGCEVLSTAFATYSGWFPLLGNCFTHRIPSVFLSNSIQPGRRTCA